MNRPDLPIEGGCRCDRVRFRIDGAVLLTSACHCTGCQRMTGSAFSLSVAVPSDGFAVIAGEPKIGGLHRPDVRHHHCGWCDSWLYTVPEPDIGFVNVRAGALDEPSWVVPFVETFAGEKLPWATTPARHTFETLPAADEWQHLIAEYQVG